LRRQIAALAMAGSSISEIQAKTNISYASAASYRLRLGLSKRKERDWSKCKAAIRELPPERRPAPFRVAMPDRLAAGSDPLPPMHPISWGAIAL
jgi:hypothetical protein